MYNLEPMSVLKCRERQSTELVTINEQNPLADSAKRAFLAAYLLQGIDLHEKQQLGRGIREDFDSLKANLLLFITKPDEFEVARIRSDNGEGIVIHRRSNNCDNKSSDIVITSGRYDVRSGNRMQVERVWADFGYSTQEQGVFTLDDTELSIIARRNSVTKALLSSRVVRPNGNGGNLHQGLDGNSFDKLVLFINEEAAYLPGA